MSAEQPKRRWRVTRRGFLTGAGATAGVLSLGVVFGRAPFYRMLASNPAESDPPPTATMLATPDAWFEITADDQIKLFLAKVEMGQGIHTALAQIAAEELDARWDQVEVVQASTSFGPGDQLGTQASASITSTWQPLRTVAATIRESLKLSLATRLNADVSQFKTEEGKVVHIQDDQISMTYGEIVAFTPELPELPAEPSLKARSNYGKIGQSHQRVDLPAKITGEAVYAYDVRVDGMLYGAVVHPPFVGATMTSASAGTAAEMPGVVEVVIDQRDNLAGVVAQTRSQAWRALSRLEIEWSSPTAMSTEEVLDQLDVSGRGYQMQIVGNTGQALNESITLESEYMSPLGIHATMSPQAALADVRADGVTIWADAQWPESTRTAVATRLGLTEADVDIRPTYIGGGFGRKLIVESAEEAALLSRAVGKPVHVGWNRRTSNQIGFYRPPTRNRIQARLDNGRITAWETTHASGETIFPTLNLVARTFLGVDSGSYNGTINFYEGIPNRHMTANIVQLPIRTGLWRGLGMLGNVFAMEGVMDELAEMAGADPIQFRLDHLGDSELNQRMAVALEKASELANWSEPVSAGRGRGVAMSADTGTISVMIAEVSQDELGLKVDKVTCVVDAGLIINPDGARAQIEGSVMMGASAALTEVINIANGEIREDNFDRYTVLRIDRAPEVVTHLIDSPLDPRGLGEFAIGPIAAAIANAAYNLTGERKRELPLM